MRKISVTSLCILACSVLWVGCFRSEAGQFIWNADGTFDPKPLVIAAEFGGTRAQRSYAASSAMIASEAALAMPNTSVPHTPDRNSRRFDHLLADTSSAQAMAPPKSETADSFTARSQ
ncbi:MAG: hypothetical protein WBG50_03255 [Desulfomonilaceae bacterium]